MRRHHHLFTLSTVNTSLEFGISFFGFFFSLAFFFSGGLFFFPVPLDFSSFVQLVYSIQKKNGAERELEGRAGNELIARGLEHPSRV